MLRSLASAAGATGACPTCSCVRVGGAVQQRAAGQAAQDHGGHQLIHVHFLWSRLAAGRHRLLLGNTGAVVAS